MTENLLRHIQRFGIGLEPEEASVLLNYFQSRSFDKGEFILREGDKVRYETFVIQGMTRTYTPGENDQDAVIAFGPEDWWIGDLYGFFTGSPTPYNIDCLEPTTVLQISADNLSGLCLRLPKLNAYFRDLYRNSLIAMERRLRSTLIKTAAERYREFLIQYPRIGDRVPNHQIAAFLGITPQSLSRIRRSFLNAKR